MLVSRQRRPAKEYLVRLARIVAIASPIAACIGLLAHLRGLGWDYSAGYYVRTQGGWVLYDGWGFAGRPIFWGPWAQTSYPTGVVLLAPIALWFLYGLLVSVPVDWWLSRLKRREQEGE